MKKTLLILMLLVCSISSAMAQIPMTLNFQGRLIKDNQAVTSATDVTIEIYDAATGGRKLHTETQNIIPDNGYFNIVIGSQANNPIKELPSLSKLWYQISVAGQTLGDRVMFDAVPYALSSQNADYSNRAARSDSAGYATPIGDAGGVLSGQYPNPTFNNTEFAKAMQKNAGSLSAAPTGPALGVDIEGFYPHNLLIVKGKVTPDKLSRPADTNKKQFILWNPANIGAYKWEYAEFDKIIGVNNLTNNTLPVWDATNNVFVNSSIMSNIATGNVTINDSLLIKGNVAIDSNLVVAGNFGVAGVANYTGVATATNYMPVGATNTTLSSKGYVDTTAYTLNRGITRLSDSINIHRTAINNNTTNIANLSNNNVAIFDSLTIYRTDINTNATNIIHLGDSINVHRTAINTNTTNIAHLGDSINIHRTAINTNTSNIANNTTNITRLGDSINVHRTAINTNTTNIANNTTNITRLGDSINVHRTAINTNTTNIAHLGDSINVHRTAINTNTTNIANNTTNITRLGDSINVHRTAINTNTTNIAHLGDSINVHRTAINTNTTNIANNTTNITRLGDSIAAQHVDINLLGDSIAAHRVDINLLGDSINVHRTAINTNTSNIANNTTNITRLGDSIAAHRVDINLLGDSINVHRTAINTNTSNIANNTTNITRLGDSIAAHRVDINLLGDSLAAHRTDINALVVDSTYIPVSNGTSYVNSTIRIDSMNANRKQTYIGSTDTSYTYIGLSAKSNNTSIGLYTKRNGTDIGAYADTNSVSIGYDAGINNVDIGFQADTNNIDIGYMAKVRNLITIGTDFRGTGTGREINQITIGTAGKTTIGLTGATTITGTAAYAAASATSPSYMPSNPTNTTLATKGYVDSKAGFPGLDVVSANTMPVMNAGGTSYVNSPITIGGTRLPATAADPTTNIGSFVDAGIGAGKTSATNIGNFAGTNTTNIGNFAGTSNTSIGNYVTGTNNTSIGYEAGTSTTTIGGFANITAGSGKIHSTTIGKYAGISTTSIGYDAGTSTTEIGDFADTNYTTIGKDNYKNTVNIGTIFRGDGTGTNKNIINIGTDCATTASATVDPNTINIGTSTYGRSRAIVKMGGNVAFAPYVNDVPVTGTLLNLSVRSGTPVILINPSATTTIASLPVGLTVGQILYIINTNTTNAINPSTPTNALVAFTINAGETIQLIWTGTAWSPVMGG